MASLPWTRLLSGGLAGAALGLHALTPAPAAACGGFFCSQNAPVNQAAERIIFADEGDGNVTAIIEIMYEGPSEAFSWLLPVTSVPTDLETVSTAVFDKLQAATNPTYSLTLRTEGTCKQDGLNGGTTGLVGGGSTGGFAQSADAGTSAEDGGVTVEASGEVGPFEWHVISFDENLSDPADAATRWLEDNGYDVGEGAPGLLRPYLEDGLNLLALRLTKDKDAGAIRPLKLTYPAQLPMIPIKLTAVAANENMGVMAFLLASSRGVPKNYLALELNEARINWFNAALTYGDVVNEAADDAGGQGFVTEYADTTEQLGDVIWSANDERLWSDLRTGSYGSLGVIWDRAYQLFSNDEGFWDAAEASVTPPDGVTIADLRSCPFCYFGELQFTPTQFFDALETEVVAPLRSVQAMFDSHEYMTRLYTTMSAAEMTVDPLFTFNPDLETVSNVHTAERITECNEDVYEWEAPWRIELPQGGVVRGTADQVGTWPDSFGDQPANGRILRLSESGAGVVVEDNLKSIGSLLDAYNADIPGGTGGSSTGGSSSGSSSGGSSSGSSSGGLSFGEDGGDAGGGGGGCSASSTSPAAGGLMWFGALLGGFWFGRRRSQRA